MNQITRNLAVVLFGSLTSALTAAALIYFEARTGQTLFGYALWTYVPVGAVGAGFLGAIGYLAGSLVLRIRPAKVLLLGVVAIAAGTVFLGQSAEFGLFMGARGETRDLASFSQLLVSSMAHSPLLSGSSSSSSDSSSSASSGAAPAQTLPASGDSDSRVNAIGGGVQGMLSSGDVSNSSSVQRVSQVSQGIESFGSGVKSHSSQLVLAGLQIASFMIGGLVVFAFLRSLSYCEDCGVFLTRKGKQTRYFKSSAGIQNSADDFLTTVKSSRLQECIEAHFGVGAATKDRFTEYASTIEIRRCSQCQTHRLSFSAKRKAGGGWKDMSVLAHTAFSIEPIDVMRA